MYVDFLCITVPSLGQLKGSGIKVLDPNSDDLSSTHRPTQWEERTDFYKLFSDLLNTPLYTHSVCNKINK